MTVLKQKYTDFIVYNYKETELNDFNAIVASVGGSLGLFLGFSFYHHGMKLINKKPSKY